MTLVRRRSFNSAMKNDHEKCHFLKKARDGTGRVIVDGCDGTSCSASLGNSVFWFVSKMPVKHRVKEDSSSA